MRRICDVCGEYFSVRDVLKPLICATCAEKLRREAQSRIEYKSPVSATEDRKATE